MKITDNSLLIIFMLFSVLITLLLGYTGTDDSHITYFASDSWAAGRGIVNYNGELIEQSSTLLYTLLLGLLVKALAIHASYLGPLLSAFLYGLLIITVYSYLSTFKKSKLALFSLLSVPLFYWSLSGMENSLYALLNFVLCYLIMLYFSSIQKKKNTIYIIFLISVCAGLLAITRPEFIFVGVCSVTLFIFFTYIQPIKIKFKVAPSLAIVIGMSVAVLSRVILGLEVFPNPVIAKQPDINLIYNFYRGIIYFAKTFLLVPFSSCVALWGFLCVFTKIFTNSIDEWELPYYLFLLAFVMALSLFALTTGGDHMEAGRFLTTPMFLGAFGGICLSGMRNSKWLVLLFCAGFSYDAFKISQQPYGGFPIFLGYEVEVENFKPAVLENLNVIHSRDLTFIDKAIPILRDAANESEEKIVIASVQAGMVPYYLFKTMGNELYFVDLVGLTTKHLHGCYEYSVLPYSPYHDINALQECIATAFDFVYDVELDGDSSWPRLKNLTDAGCTAVLMDSSEIGASVPWSTAYNARQFLVDCRSIKKPKIK